MLRGINLDREGRPAGLHCGEKRLGKNTLTICSSDFMILSAVHCVGTTDIRQVTTKDLRNQIAS